MKNVVKDNPSLYKFFHRNLRQAFTDLNLKKGRELDYIAAILTHFARTANLYRIKQLDNKKVETVVEMLLEIENRQLSNNPLTEDKEILVRKHVGDFTLFMSGIFREYVQNIGVLDFYLMEGSRSYRHVSEYTRKNYEETARVFHILSRKFESYSSALDYLKKVYFYYPEIDDFIKSTLNRLLS